MSDCDMSLLDLPNLVLLEIFKNLSYDEVSKKRLVCRRFDQVCQQVLNGGFNKAIKQHSISFKRIKALLPRRESERRNHCLARHADILTSIETRISMLSMTYTKFMDLNLCCFIPGRVLDEVFRILRLIAKTTKPLRPHEVLQELRDISSMAIEHFDENIANNLKKTFANSSSSSKICSGSSFCSDNRRLAATSGLGNISFSGMGGSSPPTLATPSLTVYGSNPYVLEPLTQRLGLIGDRLNGSSFKTVLSGGGDNLSSPSTSSYLGDHSHPQNAQGECLEARSTMMYLKKLEAEYKKGALKMHRMQQVQNLQNKRLQQALSSVAELNGQIVELKKRLEDVDAKNREISANIRHINGGGSPDADKTSPPPLCNQLKNEDTKDSINATAALLASPATSTICENPMDNTIRKRHIDDPDITSTPATNVMDINIVNSLEDCDLPSSSLKKSKLDA